MARDVVRRLPMGAECCASDVPSRGLASAGALWSPVVLRVSLGGASGRVGDEKCRHGHIGKTLCGYCEMLAEKADIGSYLAKQGKQSRSLSW